MMTAESMLSKRPVLTIFAALFFLLKLFSSHVYCIGEMNLDDLEQELILFC